MKSQPKSDEVIVKQICSGDTAQFAKIVDRYQAKLVRYISYLIGDAIRAQDITQDSFIKAFINIQGFDGYKKFSSWIYRIAHNEAMNAVKKHRKELPWQDFFDPPAKQDIVEDLITKEKVEQAHQCLAEMQVMYAEPLTLFYLDEKSYDEISDILRIPMGTVATRISRAKLLMKKLCQTKI